MGTRLKDIIFDKHDDLLYEDERAMKLTHYIMAERCLQEQMAGIFNDKGEGDYEILYDILENGFKGFHNMEPSELIDEYKSIEEKWYDLYETNQLYTTVDEDDPINELEKENIGPGDGNPISEYEQGRADAEADRLDKGEDE